MHPHSSCFLPYRLGCQLTQHAQSSEQDTTTVMITDSSRCSPRTYLQDPLHLLWLPGPAFVSHPALLAALWLGIHLQSIVRMNIQAVHEHTISMRAQVACPPSPVLRIAVKCSPASNPAFQLNIAHVACSPCQIPCQSAVHAAAHAKFLMAPSSHDPAPMILMFCLPSQ